MLVLPCYPRPVAVRDPRLARALGTIRRTLEGAGWEPAGRRLLVAWSGGPDSGALLGTLRRVARAWDLELAVGHVDHGLRPESGAEAELVARACARWGIELRAARLELARGPGLADRARRARRARLAGWARELGADAVALGHTATDQAETMLMHLARGAGLRGAGGIRPVTRADGAVWVRPLLALTRAEARELAGALGVPVVDDPSNHDPRHLRVRVRKTVLPALRTRHPEAERALAAAARDLQDAEDALELWAGREWAARAGRPGELDVTGAGDLPRAVRARLVLRLVEPALRQAAGHGGPRRAIEEVTRAMAGGGRARTWVLPGGHRLELRPRNLLRLLPARAPAERSPGPDL